MWLVATVWDSTGQMSHLLLKACLKVYLNVVADLTTKVKIY